AAASLRAIGSARSDGAGPRGRVVAVAADLRLRRARARDDRRYGRRAGRRRGRDRRLHGPRARAWSADATPTDGLASPGKGGRRRPHTRGCVAATYPSQPAAVLWAMGAVYRV